MSEVSFTRKIIRCILKIPATPFFVIHIVFSIAFGYCVQLLEWLYEDTYTDWEKDFNHKFNASEHEQLVEQFKKWFTRM